MARDLQKCDFCGKQASAVILRNQGRYADNSRVPVCVECVPPNVKLEWSDNQRYAVPQQQTA